jgi:hypothetical protein
MTQRFEQVVEDRYWHAHTLKTQTTKAFMYYNARGMCVVVISPDHNSEFESFRCFNCSALGTGMF